MTTQAVFQGLIFDESGNPVEVTIVGRETFYVIDDDGFRRHIESKHVDRQILEQMFSLIEGNEELISQGTMKMLGQEDIFTKAAIESSLKDVESQIEQMMVTGLPEDARMWLGMVGFRATIDIHGTVIHIEQPTAPDAPWDEE
jgi:hypothetical protein